MNFLRHLFSKDPIEADCSPGSASKYDAPFLDRPASDSALIPNFNPLNFQSQKPPMRPSVNSNHDLKAVSARRPSAQIITQRRKSSVQSESIILSTHSPAASNTRALSECTRAIGQNSNTIHPIRMSEDISVSDDHFDDAVGEFRQRRAYTNPVQMFHEPRNKKIRNISEPLRNRTKSETGQQAFCSPADSQIDGDGENFTKVLQGGKMDYSRHPSLRDRQRSNKSTHKHSTNKNDRPRSYSGSPVHRPSFSNPTTVQILDDTLSKSHDKPKGQARKERPPSLGVLEEILAGVRKEKPSRSSPTGGGSRKDHHVRGSPGAGDFSPGAGVASRPPASVRLCEIKILPNKNVSQVLPDLFLGSREIAHDLQALRRLGVTHILNVTSEVQDKFPDQFIYDRIPISDMPSVRLSDHIPAAIRFIDSVRRPVSCASPSTAAGRSVSVASPSAVSSAGASSASRIASIASCTAAGGKLASHSASFSATSTTADTISAVESSCAAAAEYSNSNISVVANETASSTAAGTPLASRIGCIPAGTGKVLVHCFYGNSRSASIIMAYLMKVERMRFSDTLELLQILRPEVNPNEGFRRQLKEYDRVTFGS